MPLVSLNAVVSLMLRSSEGKVFFKDKDITSSVAVSDLKRLLHDDPTGEVEYDVDVEVSGHYMPATRDYFDNSFGNWLPGDPAEIEHLEVKVGGVEIAHLLSAHQVDSLEMKLMEHA